MAVKYPTADEVKQAFDAAFPAGQVFDPECWSELARGVPNPTWKPAVEGIEGLQVAGARLFKVQWEFGIDIMNTSSEVKLRLSAENLQKSLAALINGEDVSFDTLESAVKNGPVTLVQCWSRGIIG